MTTPNRTPEQHARERIDHQLEQAGWVVQDHADMNLGAARGVAVREFKLLSGHGRVDYLLFVDGKAVGVFEAKKQGHTLIGVEGQAQHYAEGLPPGLHPPVAPLPFCYLGTGSKTRFTNLLDPKPRSRELFHLHQPATLAEWLAADTLDKWLTGAGHLFTGADATRPSSLRGRLRALPPVERGHLYDNQLEAIINLEKSLFDDKPRALVQMATGSGKSLMAVASIYRLIKFGGARRVLFLVDRNNLAEQLQKEFEGYRTPDDNRKFTELYNVQRLTSNTIGASAKVVITTVQRLFSMLKGEDAFDEELEDGSLFEKPDGLPQTPVGVSYSSGIPPETFDFVWIDECHRSIYTLWRQVLEYFDAHLVGLTATPSARTFGFFNKNLVMEYTHERAVADGVNVDFDVYKIRTRITEEGSTVEAEPGVMVGQRDLRTRDVRWSAPDEDVVYGAHELDRRVVAKDQIRTLIRTFKERLFTEIFPSRTQVPKTLIFAKDDSHAEDIVGIVREEFGAGNAFAQKITYKVTSAKPADLIQAFRNQYYPRIAVTVDMVATGTDIRPIEIVMFMRSVQSRLLFEQMKGRGVRIIDRDALKAVTSDADAKTHFVIVDCVGVTDGNQSDTEPLERKPTVPLKALLDHVAAGGTEPDVLSSLLSRLTRLERQCDDDDDARLRTLSGGPGLGELAVALVLALDVDRQVEAARGLFGLGPDTAPDDTQLEQAAQGLALAACEVLRSKPALRTALVELKRLKDQLIDDVSVDEVREAGFSEAAKERAKALVTSFREFLEEHKDEITALQFFYAQPYAERLHYKDIKALAEAIQAPPRAWTPELLWRAYETLDRSKVRGSGRRMLTDVVSLVRFALEKEDALVPFPEQVHARFERWLAQQANRGRQFSEAQRRWLTLMRDHIATSLEIEMDDFDYAPFAEEGGLGRAAQVFGSELGAILGELNEVLAA